MIDPKFKHNPIKHYKRLVEDVELYIDKFSHSTRNESPTRRIPDEKLTKEEEKIAAEVGDSITTICQKYKKELIDAKEVASLTGNILYSKYKPHILYRILDRSLYDFLEKASEYDSYLSKLKKNNSISSQTFPLTRSPS